MSDENSVSSDSTPEPETTQKGAEQSKPSIQIGSQRPDDQPEVKKSDNPSSFSEFMSSELGDAQSAPVRPTAEAGSYPPPRVKRVSAELQAEIDSALGDLSLDDLMMQESGATAEGEIELDSKCQGTVVKIHQDSIFFSLGSNSDGIASLRQFDEPPEIGAKMNVVPVKFLREEGLYELVVPGASIQVGDWSDLAEGVVVEVTVTGHNKGGLECEVNRIRGFIPAGQISTVRVEDFEQFVGEKLQCVVTEADPDRRNLVVSHRAVLEREKQEKREKTLAELEVGQLREGVVSRLMDFGAFVDLGGVDGLIHLSQLSWDRVKHPSEVVSEGDAVKVKIERIDEETGKIGLSYRDLLVNPWDLSEQSYPVGAVVKGNVTKLMEFGAFVRLEAGIEGLVHISELANHRVHRVSNVVSEGDEVEVKILSVDSNAQKISLSMKAAQAAPPAESAEETEKPEEPKEPPRKLIVEKPDGPLKGGVGRSSGGEQFGLKW